VDQGTPNQQRLLVVADGDLTYLQAHRQHPGCAATSARLGREHEAAEVLLFEPASGCGGADPCVLLVVRTPAAGAKDYLLEFLSSDGSVCDKYAKVALGP